jgi:small subunit ribosomal protein S16
MLAIRMQRTGRKGHAMFRMVVQESRLTPTSGKVVARLGSYDPHGKTLVVDKEKASFYLSHGAQPSERVARLLKADGVALPDWVKQPADRKGETRSAEKRRSTRPPEPKAPEVEETPAAEAPTEEVETPAEEAVPEEAPVAEEAAESEETEPTPEETPPATEETPAKDSSEK